MTTSGHRSRGPLLALACSVALTLVLTACSGKDAAPTDDVSTSQAPDPTSTPVSVDGTPVTTVDLGELGKGPLPALDAVLGRTLVHDGTQITLKLPAGALFPTALGTYDGVPIISTGLGSQLFTVAADGTTTPLGEPHQTYDHGPRLVLGTGHVLIFDSDRGTARSTYTVLDATSGKEVAVLRDSQKLADLRSLAPADFAVVAAVSGAVAPEDTVAALSPDRTLEITSDTTDPDNPDSPTVLSVGPVGGDGEATTTLLFTTRTGDVVFESDEAFLVVVAVSDGDAVEPEQVVIRCTIAGECARATRSSRNVTIGGSGAVTSGS